MSQQTHSLVNSVKEFTAYTIFLNGNEDSKQPLKFRVVTVEACIKKTNTGWGGEKIIWATAKYFSFLQHGRRVDKAAPANSGTMLLFSAFTYIVSSKLSLLGSLPVCCVAAPQRQ